MFSHFFDIKSSGDDKVLEMFNVVAYWKDKQKVACYLTDSRYPKLAAEFKQLCEDECCIENWEFIQDLYKASPLYKGEDKKTLSEIVKTYIKENQDMFHNDYDSKTINIPYKNRSNLVSKAKNNTLTILDFSDALSE